MNEKTKQNPKGAGRTTDTFNPEKFKEQVAEYLKQRQDQVEVIPAITGKGTIIYSVKLPTIEGLAAFLNLERKTLYNWAEKHDEAKIALEKIKQIQLERLIDKGLGGNYNPTITKLLLSHNHGIKEEISAEVKSEVTNKFDDQQINRIAERIATRGRSDGNSSGEKESD